MRKTICSGIITFGILVSLSSCYAFDYRSEEAGFSVDIPDDNTIIVSKDLFAAGSNKSGMHGIAAISQQSIEKYTKTALILLMLILLYRKMSYKYICRNLCRIIHNLYLVIKTIK